MPNFFKSYFFFDSSKGYSISEIVDKPNIITRTILLISEGELTSTQSTTSSKVTAKSLSLNKASTTKAE